MEEESKGDPNAWVVAFGDLITLLMTFFVLIISMSTIKMDKIVEVINNNEGFGDSIFRADLKETGVFNEKIMSKMNFLVDKGELPAPVNNLDLVNEAMIVFISENELVRVIDLEMTKKGFIIRIRADILFEPGLARLKEEYLFLLDKIAELLSMVTNDVRIDGHTDDRYSDDDYANHKLSIERATSVCSYFIEEGMLSPSRFGVAGYGGNKPYLPNISEENRAKNRRVEIIIKEKAER
ncbi:MAG: flagellar motor protein MotB [Candidatus Scalinduaceae bacterium]